MLLNDADRLELCDDGVTVFIDIVQVPVWLEDGVLDEGVKVSSDGVRVKVGGDADSLLLEDNVHVADTLWLNDALGVEE